MVDDIQGDPKLAAFFAEHGFKPVKSQIVATDILATSFNQAGLKIEKGERIVDLSCGHKAVTNNQRDMTCPRCAQLLVHGMDYEAWISGNGGTLDGMIWREDPCRFANERTDLAGNFVDDPEHVTHD